MLLWQRPGSAGALLLFLEAIADAVAASKMTREDPSAGVEALRLIFAA